MPDEYIKRSDARAHVCHAYTKGLNLLLAYIDVIPAADVEPVRHGRWIQTKNGDFACSLCGYTVRGEPMNYPPDGQMMLRVTGHHYCGDCGAKMDKEEDHD